METRSRITTDTHAAVFSDDKSAEAAFNAAIRAGYAPEEINVVMLDDTRNKYYPGATTETTTQETVVSEKGDKSMEGLALGGALGGTVLGVIGAVLALGSTIIVPGVGLVIAGPLAAALVGLGAGSVAGGLVGALIGAGIPEEHAVIFEKELKKGGILITVPVHSDQDDTILLTEWKKLNGKNIF